MGADVFFTEANGADVQEAFLRVRDHARYLHGRGGYSGTIAEKGSYVVVQAEPVSSQEANVLADKLIEERDPRTEDKWGPAGAIAVGEDGQTTGWLFFGWASM